MSYTEEFNEVFTSPADNTPPRLKVLFDFKAIERYPDFIKNWVHSVIGSLSQNPAGEGFLDERGEVSAWADYSITDSKINCSEVDGLVADLNANNDVGLAQEINDLRTQVVGMWYYTLRFGMVKDKMYDMIRAKRGLAEGEPSCHEECLALYNEMMNGEKFGVSIMPRPGLFKIWIRVCDTSEECQIAYDKMTKAEWHLPDGTSGPMNGFDDDALRQWILVCRKDEDYDAAYMAAKEHGLADTFMPMALKYAESREDFFAVYSVLVKNGYPAPSQESFVRFFGQLETFDDFAMWLEFLFHWNVVPNISTSEIIFRRFNLSVGAKFDAPGFLEWFRERYRFLLGGATSSHDNWKTFFGRMKNVLKRDYQVSCYI